MHIPVLLGEAVEKLNLKKGDAVVDATLGGGGHSREIMNKIGKNGILVAFDLDSEAVSEFEKSLKKQKKEPEVFLKIENFAKIDEVLESENLSKVDAILADLGWRSDQMENENYGMSFQKDSPLDMRLAPNHTVLGKAQNHADRGKVQNHAVRGNAQNHADGQRPEPCGYWVKQEG